MIKLKNLYKNFCLGVILGLVLFLGKTSFGMESNKILVDQEKSVKKIVGLYDPYLYSDKILPYVKDQQDLLNFRLACKCFDEAFCINSEKRPIKFKTINFLWGKPKESDAFLEWIKKNKAVEFCTELSIKSCKDKKFTGELLRNLPDNLVLFEVDEFCDIDEKCIDELKIPKKLKILVFEIFSSCQFLKNSNAKLEELSIEIYSENKDFSVLKFLPSSLRKLKILELHDLKDCSFVENLENLEELDLSKAYNIRDYSGLKKLYKLRKLLVQGDDSGMIGRFTDEQIKNLPDGVLYLNISGKGIKGESLKDLPKGLKEFVLFSMENIEKKYLNDLPKSLERVIIACTAKELVDNSLHKEKIKILRDKGIKVLGEDGKDYPEEKSESRWTFCFEGSRCFDY